MIKKMKIEFVCIKLAFILENKAKNILDPVKLNLWYAICYLLTTKILIQSGLFQWRLKRSRKEARIKGKNGYGEI